jgi:hypothetical protein
LTSHAGEGFDSGGCFRDRGRRLLAKLGFERRAVGVEDTARPMRLEVFQLLDPTADIGVEIAMEARFCLARCELAARWRYQHGGFPRG